MSKASEHLAEVLIDQNEKLTDALAITEERAKRAERSRDAFKAQSDTRGKVIQGMYLQHHETVTAFESRIARLEKAVDVLNNKLCGLNLMDQATMPDEVFEAMPLPTDAPRNALLALREAGTRILQFSVARTRATQDALKFPAPAGPQSADCLCFHDGAWYFRHSQCPLHQDDA